ncbi:hypothetical protein [Dactylosporangium sp. NPDC000521]|uniref:hypothetical protein n=1 Tax=Dactylosporangium sp. NPDC000521 TaxID=3363975 RepID=UPI00367C9D64
MSVIFRINSVTLATEGGSVFYPFRGPLTVLDGPVGTGKSTLLELIKYGVGGRAKFSPVVIDHISSVSLEVVAGERRFRLRRSIHGDVDRMAVTDLVSAEDLGILPVEDSKGREVLTVGKLLLTSLGLPHDVRASAATAKATSKPSLITFNDVWTSLYVEQPEIDRSIAHHSDSYREPKRRSVFELFFGLTDQAHLKMKADLLVAEQELVAAEAEERTIFQFLADVGVESREQVLNAQSLAIESLARGREQLRRLSDEASDPLDAHTDVLRDLLATTQERVDDLRHEIAMLEKTNEDRRALAAGIRQDLARLQRAHDAGLRLADIEFIVCPRCSQSIRDRKYPPGACRLCLQPDVVPVGDGSQSYETGQMMAQAAEVEELLASGSGRLSDLQISLASAEEHARKLANAVDERTRELVSPRLQAYADVSNSVGVAEERLAAMEERLRYWDRAGDISLVAANARSKRNSLKDRTARRETELKEVRDDLISTMTEDYAHTLERLGVPGVQKVRIDDKTFLPFVNGVRFDRVSTGGIRTALIVGYWVTVVATALRQPTSDMPAFLILDTPRKSIGAGDALAVNLYRQLDILAESYKDRLQIIVADNGLPAEYARRWQQFVFDYPTPVVSTVAHPGPAEVVTLDRMVESGVAA